MLTATICTIGDEILIGQIIDTNSSKIATALNSIGVKVISMVSTSDNQEEIIKTVDSALEASNILIITGGLGPTKDDITKKTLAKISGAKSFYQSEEQLEIIKDILSTRNIALSDINLEQALVPDTCSVILNKCGTAPNMQFVLDDKKYGHKAIIFSLPGVPFEAEAAIPSVIASIKEHFTLSDIYHKTICTFGIPESTLAKQIEDWEDNLPNNIHLAYLPNPILGVRLRLSVYDTEKDNANREIEHKINSLKAILGKAIYGFNDTSLQAVIGEKLISKSKTLSCAESCTGGMIASLITSVSGASAYFYGAVVSYDNSVKINTLGVNKSTINKYGAVSKECVEEMAIGVRNLMNTDYSIASSGVAGPNGGSVDKPVGTVWIAVASQDKVLSIKLNFKGDRSLNVQRFTSNALNFFRLNFLE